MHFKSVVVNVYVLSSISLAKPRQNLKTSEKQKKGKIVLGLAVYVRSIRPGRYIFDAVCTI